VYAVLETLGITRGTDPPIRILENHLAERRLMLVLDNCEHMIDACAELVGRLLRAAPELRVLCTSRQPLGIVGEALYVVPPLGVPARGAPLPRGDASVNAALALFAARAAAVSPGFALTADNRPVLVEICERLDGLPLAIELAAVQLRVRSVADLHAGLARRVHSLSARHASPVHHRGLRDSFDWSFELCSPAERRLWPRLAVFAGSFSLDAVAGVCADEDLPAEGMLDVVAGLVDKSIVLREEAAGDVRYRLLETVREYGRQRLSEDALAALRRRHRDWYLELAERFEAQWFGPDQPRWSARLRADLDNLRGALGWCLDTPGEARAGLRMVGALQFFSIGCGRLTEGRYWLERMLPADPAPTAARVVALSAYTMCCSPRTMWTRRPPAPRSASPSPASSVTRT
jgi:non-specific serine/threonine protein kinase